MIKSLKKKEQKRPIDVTGTFTGKATSINIFSYTGMGGLYFPKSYAEIKLDPNAAGIDTAWLSVDIFSNRKLTKPTGWLSSRKAMVIKGQPFEGEIDLNTVKKRSVWRRMLHGTPRTITRERQAQQLRLQLV